MMEAPSRKFVVTPCEPSLERWSIALKEGGNSMFIGIVYSASDRIPTIISAKVHYRELLTPHSS